ncbi:bifunctional ADP-dependent NAD(P)H-hydrate dehydratase/NAD(P)H-hydrate epimerase [Liberibacter crescens]|nr:bifunctional ADP-dependent NAD(P)H-hydrate dehydratase/NAD(P)H-hydrate epimerase [Liberibacter crescens]
MLKAEQLAARVCDIDSWTLMQKAGQAVAESALRLFPEACRYVIFCGPGGNGGDGYITAKILFEHGMPVVVYRLGHDKLSDDCKHARSICPVTPLPLDQWYPVPGDVVIDALFGGGLSRDMPTEAVNVVRLTLSYKIPVISVDFPSGVCGETGKIRGFSFRASYSITFMTRKSGHVLLPGRDLCGVIEIVNIGIPHRFLLSAWQGIRENTPSLWKDVMPKLRPDIHKYQRGYLGVFSGKESSSGAGRLAAQAGLKSGAGVVTLAVPSSALNINASSLTAVMLRVIDTEDNLNVWLSDQRRLSAFVLGPGFGDLEKARRFVALLSLYPLVLDADGITAFQNCPELLFSYFNKQTTRLVMTPHEGEFSRIFPDIAASSQGKIDKAKAAAIRSGAVIVYKGGDTVIAGPDGRVLINTNASSNLATAGSGDILSGIIGAHLATGVPAFEAAAAAVWRHGEAAYFAGKTMTAEDLIQSIQCLPE